MGKKSALLPQGKVVKVYYIQLKRGIYIWRKNEILFGEKGNILGEKSHIEKDTYSKNRLIIFGEKRHMFLTERSALHIWKNKQIMSKNIVSRCIRRKRAHFIFQEKRAHYIQRKMAIYWRERAQLTQLNPLLPFASFCLAFIKCDYNKNLLTLLLYNWERLSSLLFIFLRLWNN